MQDEENYEPKSLTSKEAKLTATHGKDYFVSTCLFELKIYSIFSLYFQNLLLIFHYSSLANPLI